MSDHNQHIDDLFRQGLGDFSEVPPPAVWEALETRLPDNRRKRRFIWWFWLILLLVSAGGGAIIASKYFSGRKQPQAHHTTPNNPIPAPDNIPAGISTPTGTDTATDNTDNTNTTADDTAANASSLRTSSGNNTSGEGVGRISNTPATADGSKDQAHSSKPAAGKRNAGNQHEGAGNKAESAPIEHPAAASNRDATTNAGKSVSTPQANRKQQEQKQQPATAKQNTTAKAARNNSVNQPKAGNVTKPIKENNAPTAQRSDASKSNRRAVQPVPAAGKPVRNKEEQFRQPAATAQQPEQFSKPVMAKDTAVSFTRPAVPAETAAVLPAAKFKDEKDATFLSMDNYQNGADGASQTDNDGEDIIPTPGAGGGGGGGGNDDKKEKPKRKKDHKASQWEGGVKAGIEKGFGDFGATRAVGSIYLQHNISDKVAIGVQPTFKYGSANYSALNAGTGESYYNVTGRQLDSVVTPVFDDTFFVGTARSYTYREYFDSVSIINEVTGKTWSVELPVLLSYKISEVLTFYGGPTFSFGNKVVINQRQRIGGSFASTAFTDSTYTPLELPPNTRTIDDFDSVVSYSLPNISEYTPASGLNPSGNPIRIGYMAGFSLNINNFLVDVAVQQQLSGYNQIVNQNIKKTFTQPYFRATIGYRLFGGKNKKYKDADRDEQRFHRVE